MISSQHAADYPNPPVIEKRRSQTLMNVQDFFDLDRDSEKEDLCINFSSSFYCNAPSVQTKINKEKSSVYQIKYRQSNQQTESHKTRKHKSKSRKGTNYHQRASSNHKKNRRRCKSDIGSPQRVRTGPPKRALPPLVINSAQSNHISHMDMDMPAHHQQRPKSSKGKLKKSKSSAKLAQSHSNAIPNSLMAKIDEKANMDYFNNYNKHFSQKFSKPKEAAGSSSTKYSFYPNNNHLHYTWNAREVYEWISSLSQSKSQFELYGRKFLELHITGKDLAFLNGHILQYKVGVYNVDHQNVILCGIQAIVNREDNEKRKMRNAKLKEVCNGCHERINDDFDILGQDGLHYHSQCFKCDKCGVSLVAVHYVNFQDPYRGKQILCRCCANGPFISQSFHVPQK